MMAGYVYRMLAAFLSMPADNIRVELGHLSTAEILERLGNQLKGD